MILRRMLTAFLVFIVLYHADPVFGHGEREDSGATLNSDEVCNQDPEDCDGQGLQLLPEGRIYTYGINGSWKLEVDRAMLRRRNDHRTAQITGSATVVRVSKCRVKVTVENATLSDGDQNIPDTSMWFVMSGGTVRESCVLPEDVPSSKSSSSHQHHGYSLARSIISAITNSAEKLEQQEIDLIETDHYGSCPTHYNMINDGYGSFTIFKTRDMTQCYSVYDRDTKWKSRIADKMEWTCKQSFYMWKGEERSHLGYVECNQKVEISGPVSFFSDLQLSRKLPDTFYNQHEESSLVVLANHDAERVFQESASDPTIMERQNTEQVLSALCTELKNRITPRATMLYPRLVTSMKKLSKDDLLQLYKQVHSGSICSEHNRLRSIFDASLEDSASGASAATMCHLMAEGVVKYKDRWLQALANVRKPTTQAINDCSRLLDVPYSMNIVLGVTAMVGKANWAWDCNEQDGIDCKSAKQGVNKVSRQLLASIGDCSHQNDDQLGKILLGLRGIGNLGIYGYEAEETIMNCAGNFHSPTSVQIAAYQTFRRGTCSKQASTWLQWSVFNETLGSEIRINAFKSLHNCNTDLAISTANVLVRKEADTQVKSFVRSYATFKEDEEEENLLFQDPKMFSRHMVADLESIFGFNNTFLETDVTFQNSFIPRSVDFNLTSRYLRHLGGSFQFGGRLENLEEVLQNIFGHEATTKTLTEFALQALEKFQHIVSEAGEDFINSHRETRSIGIDDIKNILKKVKQEVITELRGWMYWRSEGLERLFVHYKFDPFALDWDELLENWVDSILDDMYQSLINYELDITNSWAAVEEEVVLWSVMGLPIKISHQEGILASLEASSKINLYSLMTNPFASTIDFGFKPSVGAYYLASIGVASPQGPVTASFSAPVNMGYGINAQLSVQNGENLEIQFDLPDDLHQGISIKTAASFSTSAEDIDDSYLSDKRQRGTRRSHPTCIPGIQEALGLDICYISRSHEGPSGLAANAFQMYLKKADPEIQGFKILLSIKNPGSNSFFLDMQLSSVGGRIPRTNGILLGITYTPHFTVKLFINTPFYTASWEAALVNDPNLKRIELRANIAGKEYGLKAEWLMVEDGNQVSIKPRLVVGYPERPENSLLEGYFAYYISEKQKSLTIDLVTDGSLKDYVIDVGIKGTIEYRTPPTGDQSISIKNFHFSSPIHDLGIEAHLAIKEGIMETELQVTWGSEVMIGGGSLRNNNFGISNKDYDLNLHFLFPQWPEMDTRLSCKTFVYSTEVTNNFTLQIGPESETGIHAQEFHVSHTTSWRKVTPTPTHNHQHPHQHFSILHKLASRLENNIKLFSPTTNLDWTLNHVFQLTETLIENQIIANFGGEDFKIMSNFYDQSDVTFKYHMEIEVSIPTWHFSYVDTLEQRREGDILGQSVTLMPSGRIYNTNTRFYLVNKADSIILETSYETAVQEGMDTWKLVARGSFEYTDQRLSIQASAEAADDIICSLELSLDGIQQQDKDLYFKIFMWKLFEGEITLTTIGRNIDLGLSMLLIPYNREIKSKIAMGSYGCEGGTVNGELLWDVRGDMSKTLKLNMVVDVPSTKNNIDIRGSLSFLFWTWTSQLKVKLGDSLAKEHKVHFTLTLPNMVRLELQSSLKLQWNEHEILLGMNSEAKLTNNEYYQFAFEIAGKTDEDGHVELLTFEMKGDAPDIDEMSFQSSYNSQISGTERNIDINIHLYTGEDWWQPVDILGSFSWDGMKVRTVLEGSLGKHNFNLDGAGSYQILGFGHMLTGDIELKIPSYEAFKQMKTIFDASFSSYNRARKLEMSSRLIIIKNFKEIFNSENEVLIQVPKVEGKLSLRHAGESFNRHEYKIDGVFIFREANISVYGTVDDVPTNLYLRFVDGEVLEVKANYGADKEITLNVKTELQDISLGIRKSSSDSFSLSTNGIFVFHGRRMQLYHDLSITPTSTSSIIKLSPFNQQDFELTANRTKISADHWVTIVNLGWDNLVLRYNDDVHFKSPTSFKIKMEFDVPQTNFEKVAMNMEVNKVANGEQLVSFSYAENHKPIHRARLTYFTLEAPGEQVLSAKATRLVIGQKNYRDFSVSHSLNKPRNGMKLTSNMTVGNTVIIDLGVSISPSTRTVLISMCSREDECLWFRGHISARATTRVKSYAITAHTINSLLWKDDHAPLLQNSFTFTAEQSDDDIFVKSSMQRMKCQMINCYEYENQNLLQLSLNFTDSVLEILFDTTERNMKLQVEIKDEIIKDTEISFANGKSSDILLLNLWLDYSSDPNGVITTKCHHNHVAKPRGAEERNILCLLTHQSLSKDLRVGVVWKTNEARKPLSVTGDIILDIFSSSSDQLKIEMKFEETEQKYIIYSNLTKPADEYPRMLDIVFTLHPSPDNTQVGVIVLVPESECREDDAQFSFICDVESGSLSAVTNCWISSPSVKEGITLSYELEGSRSCDGLTSSVTIFNRSYSTYQKNCQNPTNIQASIARKGKSKVKDELAFKVGFINHGKLELNLLDKHHWIVTLHPPYLLHVASHSGYPLEWQWEDVQGGVTEEFDYLISKGKSFSKAWLSDLSVFNGMTRAGSISHIEPLTRYTIEHIQNITQELSDDKLFMDVIRTIHTCFEVTSMLVEASSSYLDHKLGDIFSQYTADISSYLQGILIDLGTTSFVISLGLQKAVEKAVVFLIDLPRTLKEIVMYGDHFIAEFIAWYSWTSHEMSHSQTYIMIDGMISSISENINLILSTMYPDVKNFDIENHLESLIYTLDLSVWNLWIPLPEACYVMMDVIAMVTGTERSTSRTTSLYQTFMETGRMVAKPDLLIENSIPPYKAYGAVIGGEHIITIDGRAIFLDSQCPYILLTDARDGLFTVAYEFTEGSDKQKAERDYTILIGDLMLITITSELEVNVNGEAVSLPFSSELITVTRNPLLLTVTVRDHQDREVMTLSCHVYEWACSVVVSGWLHSDTRGLLGRYDLDLSNDRTRPSGKVALSNSVFSDSWKIDKRCSSKSGIKPRSPSVRVRRLCHQFLIENSAPAFPCHSTVDVNPYLASCLAYLSEGEQIGDDDNVNDEDISTESYDNLEKYHSNYYINDTDNGKDFTTLSPLDFSPESRILEVSKEEMDVICDVVAAYSLVCKQQGISLLAAMPKSCVGGRAVTSRPVVEPKQLDLLYMIDETSCSNFTYEYLIKPFPKEFLAVGEEVGIQDIEVGMLGYGSGGGNVIYHTYGTSLLTPAQEFTAVFPQANVSLNKATLHGAVRSIGWFPFRPGSVRAVLVVDCSNQDILKFAESLPVSYLRRRFTLFAVTPENILQGSARPKVIRNTIGMDRKWVYSLRQDKEEVKDSQTVRKPQSNIAQLSLKSGGGIFSIKNLAILGKSPILHEAI